MQLTENIAVQVAVKIADAVHYMHSHNPIIIHQDLKPQNILVNFFWCGVDVGVPPFLLHVQYNFLHSCV